MENKTPYAPNNITELPLKHYRERFKAADPAEISARTGVKYVGGRFILNVMGVERSADWPDFVSEGWSDKERILFLHYLLAGKAVEKSENFLAYSEMPWGEVYDRNFRGRCVRRLIAQYGGKPEQLKRDCAAMGGHVVPGSGLICEIPFMENLAVRMILWEGDEEFPASGQILFSDNFPDAFAAEDRVIVCELMLSAMKRLSANNVKEKA